jgi:hypothetical protein
LGQINDLGHATVLVFCCLRLSLSWQVVALFFRREREIEQKWRAFLSPTWALSGDVKRPTAMQPQIPQNKWTCNNDITFKTQCPCVCPEPALANNLVVRKKTEKTEKQRTAFLIDGGDSFLQENGLFEPFMYKNHHFTKTGSGQT